MRRHSNTRTLVRRASLLCVITLLAGLGCGGTTSEPKPVPGPALKLVITKSPATIQIAGADSALTVKAIDAAGKGAPGVRIAFTLDVPNSLVFDLDNAMTNELGEATIWMRALNMIGERTVTASADSALPVTVTITVKPGRPSDFFLTPSAIRLYGAGDTASVAAVARDIAGNAVPTGAISYQVSDTTLLSLTPPTTPEGNIKIRALRAGAAQITVSSGNVTGTAPVTIFASQRTACTGVATPQTVSAGLLVTAADSVLCIAASTGGQYALIVYNESMNGADSAATTVTAYNVVPDFTILQSKLAPSLSRAATLSGTATAPKLDLRFHERLLTRSRSLRRLFGPARAARTSARAESLGRIRGPSYALNGSAPAAPVVDSLIALNVADGCTTADTRTFRVEAVGSKAIVLADTANPAGGFTRADYQRFAARFDTLVYPLDVGSFDAPSDIDGNDRVAILFTRAVNELTPPGAGSYVGGFFNPRDLFPRMQPPSLAVCPTSNEGEMFYMMVPDPSGTVHGNKFGLGLVDTLTTSTLAHEFQHLINAGRRMYVNSAPDFEETWLNEGLSHTAEELLYFRESGYAPRAALTTQAIYTSLPQFNTWVADDANNFVRFFLYLSDPAHHSPIDAGDDLETRGATWAFLRFAVDHTFGNDVGVWQRFTNSTTTGLGTLAFALQRDPKPLLRDFAVSNSGAALQNANFRMISWNFPDIYSKAFVAKAYPLAFGRLQEATAMPVLARGGAASYYKFDVPPGVQTLLRFGSSQAPLNGGLTFMVLRLR